MSITVRAYTYGYDLFCPHIIIAWHEYTRSYRTKHWDDDKEWWKKDLHSKQHYVNIFNNYGEYGIGTKRTIEDYIAFSGIQFLDWSDLKREEKIEVVEINSSSIEYKSMDNAWQDWIKENIQLKISKNVIKEILIKAQFNPQDINKELNLYI